VSNAASKTSDHQPILCIGMGNEYRHDDAVGLVVARVLKTRKIPGVTILEESGEGASLMAAWEGAETVILVDAVASGEKPGKIYRIEAHQRTVPTDFFAKSTHDFGLAEAVEMSRTLDTLPPYIVIYGIEGKSFEQGMELAHDVAEAAREVVNRIISEIEHLRT